MVSYLTAFAANFLLPGQQQENHSVCAYFMLSIREGSFHE
jgi:hypothetical protein